MGRPTDFVFLHGGAQASWVWKETVEALDRQTAGAFGRALVLDVPGCGAKRARAGEELGLDEIAAELVADIEAAGRREMVLVGHSQAGTVLPRMLALRPGLFRRAIYVSCIAPQSGRTVRNYRQTDPQAFAEESPWKAGQSAEEVRAVMRSLFCNDMSAEQADVFMSKLGRDSWPGRTYEQSDFRYEGLEATPATYVLCLRDAVLSLPWQETCAQRVGTERLVRIDAGHQVMNTRPNALAEVLLAEAA